jgi:hypothetical protein
MSQLLFVLLTYGTAGLVNTKQTIASNLEGCVAFILVRISTILFNFTRLLSACYLRYVSLSAYPTVPETNERN